MVTKRGTNNWHGAGYWYTRMRLNANDWFRNNGFGSGTPIQNPNGGTTLWGKIGGHLKTARSSFCTKRSAISSRSGVLSLVPNGGVEAGIIEVSDGTPII